MDNQRQPAPLSEAVKLAIARLTSALEQAERERNDYSDMAKQSTSEKLIAQAANATLGPELLEEKEQHEVDVGELLVVSNDRRMLRATNARLRRALDAEVTIISEQLLRPSLKNSHSFSTDRIKSDLQEGLAIAKQALASTAEGAMSKEEAAKIIDAGFGSRPDLPTGTGFVDEVRHGKGLRRRSKHE